VISSEIAKFTKSGVVFKDGREEDFDVVVLATGYQFTSSCASFMDPEMVKKVTDPVYKVIKSGCESAQEGLYFIGYNDKFGRFREIYLESLRIGTEIKKKLSFTAV